MSTRPPRRALHTTLLVATLGLTSTACVDQTPELGSSRGLSFEDWKALQYREPSGLYIVDGDTPVSGDARLFELWSAWQQDQLAVYNTNGADVVWSATQKHDLTYCVSNGFGANKARVVQALHDATEGGWEMFADVDFKYLPEQDASCTATNNNVLFDVNPVNANGEYLARSFFPNSPRDERNILIDPSAFQPGPWPLKNVLGHELGHILGFRHEHIRPESGATECFEDNDFRAVTPYDSASIMHYPQCNGTSMDLSWTMLDRTGVATIYGAYAPNPAPMVQFNEPQDGDVVPRNFVVEGNIVDSDLVSVELSVDGTVVGSLTGGTYEFSVSGQADGAHTLELKATDSRSQVTTRDIHVTVQRGTGSGDGDGGSGDGTGDGTGGDAPYIVGGCSAGGGGAGGAAALPLLGLALLPLVRRRR
ncbi:MAG TPA: Ig-like domain-containing protein [Kofleriaceae bacterium]|nr:Ig-like domain-containing protein [Kofleriaceae bacterium]